MHDVQVLLDMDGVLTNWWMDAFRIHGVHLSPEKIWRDYPGHYDYQDLIKPYKPDLTDLEFWAPMEYDFWANLGAMEDAIAIMTMLERRYGRKNITLCSSPSENHGCIPGKRAWIKKHMPKYYHDRHNQQFGSKKWLNANPRAILVDDHDKNCKDFFEHGGHSVLVPRLWNVHYMHRDRVVESIKVQLDRIDEVINASI